MRVTPSSASKKSARLRVPARSRPVEWERKISGQQPLARFPSIATCIHGSRLVPTLSVPSRGFRSTCTVARARATRPSRARRVVPTIEFPFIRSPQPRPDRARARAPRPMIPRPAPTPTGSRRCRASNLSRAAHLSFGRRSRDVEGVSAFSRARRSSTRACRASTLAPSARSRVPPSSRAGPNARSGASRPRVRASDTRISDHLDESRRTNRTTTEEKDLPRARAIAGIGISRVVLEREHARSRDHARAPVDARDSEISRGSPRSVAARSVQRSGRSVGRRADGDARARRRRRTRPLTRARHARGRARGRGGCGGYVPARARWNRAR